MKKGLSSGKPPLDKVIKPLELMSTMRKMDGSSNPSIIHSDPPSQKKKSTGLTPGQKKRKLESMPGDNSLSSSSELKNKRRRKNSLESEKVLSEPEKKKRAGREEALDQGGDKEEADGKKVAPIATSPTATPHTEEGLKEDEDRVDYGEWLDELEPFSEYPTQLAGKVEASEKEEVSEKRKEPEGEEVAEEIEALLASPEVAKGQEIESKEGVSEFPVVDIDINNFINNISLDNFITYESEAEKLAKDLQEYLNSHSINNLYFISRAGSLTYSCIEDLDGMLALNLGQEEVRTQIAFYQEILKDLEGLVAKYNL